MHKLSLLSLCLALTTWTAAQVTTPNFSHLSVDEGLSSSVVLDIYRDHRGFMWFGTDEGVNRYDGYTVKTFSDGEESVNSSVNDIVEDYDGRIWIAGFRGAGYLDPRTDRYHPVVRDINCKLITRLDRRRLLLGTSGGLRIVDATTEEFRAITTDNGLPDNRLVAFEQAPNGDFWLLFPQGLARFDPIKDRVVAYRNVAVPQQSASATPTAWRAFDIDQHGQLWLASDHRLVRYDAAADRFAAVYPLRVRAAKSCVSKRTFFVAATEGQGIWIGTDRGLFIFDEGGPTPSFRQFLKGEDQHGINNNELRCFYADGSGAMWLGTYGGGVNRYSTYNSKFYRYNYELNRSAASGNDNIVSGFATDSSGTLWLTTWGDGLKYYRPQIDTHGSYSFAEGAFDSEVFRSVTVDARGGLWLATHNNGLIALEPETGKYHHYQEQTSDLISNDLYTAHYGLGELWLGLGGGAQGLQRYTDRGGNFESLPLRSPATGEKIKYVRVMADDGHNRLFLGTHGMGLWIYNKDDGSVEHYSNLVEGSVLSDDIIYSLHYDPRGSLWVGTMTGGLNLVQLRTGRVITVGTRHGLPNRCVNGILPDEVGNLWISTNKGLAKFTPPPFLYTDTVSTAYVDRRLDRGSFVNFTVEDGLQSNEFKYGAYHRDGRGMLYFGGINGYNRFDPAEIVENRTAPPVVITDIRVFDADTWPQGRSPEVRPTIELPYGQNLLTLDYTALNYIQSQKNRYAYYLENYDTDWRYVGASRQASYTNLPPGDYTFRVKASNNNGVWNEQGASLQLVIVPPLWARTWFLLLIALAVLSALYSYYRHRLQNEKRKTRTLEAAVGRRTRDLATANDRLQQQSTELEQMWEKVHDADQEKLRFFTNISHEFRTPLTLIVGPLEDLVRGNRTPTDLPATLRLVYNNALRLLRLVNELLDLRTLDAGRATLQVQQVNFSQLLKSLVANFRFQAEVKDIKIHTTLPDPLPLWIDTEKVEKIFFNLLGNALKFTERGGEVHLSVRREEQHDTLCVSIRNSGRSIPPDRVATIFDRYVRGGEGQPGQGNGIGLALVKELVDFHRGQIAVSSQQTTGTEFLVWLPLGTKQYGAREIVEDPPGQPGQWHDTQGSTWEEEAELLPITNPEEVDENKAVVLIAEDNYDLRAYLRGIFKTKYTVLEADNGHAALELSRKFIPDFIISDLMMPGVDGLRVCGTLKADDKTSHIPIIIVTARVTEEDRLIGLRLGVDDYITKPFSSSVLRLKVDNILANRQAMRERLRDVAQFQQVDSANPTENAFYRRLIEAIEDNIAEEGFNTSKLAECLNMSRSQLYRKIQAVADRPAGDLIREVRMKKAESLLLQTDDQVSTIAYSLGFKNVSHFTKTFTAFHGVPPTKFRSRYPTPG